jgi:hypothetical protein
MRRMGEMAMENLFKLMSGQESVVQMKVEAELIVRGSTGKARSDDPGTIDDRGHGTPRGAPRWLTNGAEKRRPAPLTPLRVFCAETPIIPAIRKPELVELAIASRSRLIYLLTGDPDNMEPMIQKITAAGKVPIVNLDLLNGFSRDKYAVNYLKRVGAGGIISTHLDPLRHALAIGLYGIQRTFCSTAAPWIPSRTSCEYARACAGDSAGAGGAEDAGAGASDSTRSAGRGRRTDLQT